jgi:excisionase family DNA binding protein
MDLEKDCIPVTMMGEKAYRIKHVAKMLNMNVETIRRHVRSGKLKSYHFTKEYFITESQLQEYLHNK